MRCVSKGRIESIVAKGKEWGGEETYLDGQREDLGAVVERVAEPEEPFVAWDGGEAAYDEGAARAVPVAVLEPLGCPCCIIAVAFRLSTGSGVFVVVGSYSSHALRNKVAD